MGSRVSLLFVAGGGTLTFTLAIRGVDLDTMGVILMVMGLLGMLLSVVFWDDWLPRNGRDNSIGNPVAARPHRM